MKNPEELLVDAELIMNKMMVLQDWLEDIDLYAHIQWLRDTAELMRFVAPERKDALLHANMLSTFADFLAYNLQAARNKHYPD